MAESIFDGFTTANMIAAAAAFGLVLCLWAGILLMARRRGRARAEIIEDRLGGKPAERAGGRVLRLWRDGKEAATLASLGGGKTPLRRRIEYGMRMADIKTPLATLAAVLIGGGLLVFVLTTVLTGNWVAGLLAVGLPCAILWAIVMKRYNRRVTMFERQLVDGLGLAARSLRAGHPLLGAFRVIADEVPSPIGPVFNQICQRQALGASLEEAVRTAGEESNQPDLQMFATSVIIQLRSGGNLADMMERLAWVIRDRIRLKWRVRVLTAQTQFSKRVLLALPVLMFGVLNALNPTYMRVLYTTPTGHLLLAIACGGLLLGAFVMNRMAVFKY